RGPGSGYGGHSLQHPERKGGRPYRDHRQSVRNKKSSVMPARKIYRILVMVFLCSAPGACMKDVDFDQVNDRTLTPEVETGLVYVDTLTTCDMLDGLATEKTLCSLIPDETIGMAELHTLLELLGGENLNGPAGRINVVDEEVGFNLFSEPYVIDH